MAKSPSFVISSYWSLFEIWSHAEQVEPLSLQQMFAYSRISPPLSPSVPTVLELYWQTFSIMSHVVHILVLVGHTVSVTTLPLLHEKQP